MYAYLQDWSNSASCLEPNAGSKTSSSYILRSGAAGYGVMILFCMAGTYKREENTGFVCKIKSILLLHVTVKVKGFSKGAQNTMDGMSQVARNWGNYFPHETHFDSLLSYDVVNDSNWIMVKRIYTGLCMWMCCSAHHAFEKQILELCAKLLGEPINVQWWTLT